MRLPRALRNLPKSWIVVSVVCTAFLLTLSAAWYWLPEHSAFRVPSTPDPNNRTTVFIDDVDLIPQYWTSNVSDTSYLVETDCNCFPANVSGATYTYVVNVTDNDTVAHTISSISIDPPFALLDVVPSLPASLAAGTTTTFSVTIQVPTSPGDYDLTGAINTE
ncbi:MAG TPA: hypothetical protein VML94_02940 [Thermoplasmata archaeon]|nr:hypothetical protein [Thermoplasmata archaeon]